MLADENPPIRRFNDGIRIVRATKVEDGGAGPSCWLIHDHASDASPRTLVVPEGAVEDFLVMAALNARLRTLRIRDRALGIALILGLLLAVAAIVTWFEYFVIGLAASIALAIVGYVATGLFRMGPGPGPNSLPPSMLR